VAYPIAYGYPVQVLASFGTFASHRTRWSCRT